MATVELQTRTDLGAYSFQTELEGTLYEFAMQFNSREDYWYMTLRDDSGSDIRSGIKIVTDLPLTRLVTDLRAPPGTLICVDLLGQDRDPGLTDLGADNKLLYIESED